jgi:hypothetical protein
VTGIENKILTRVRPSSADVERDGMRASIAMKRFMEIYKNTAITLLNTFLFLVVLNLVLGAIYFVHDTYERNRKGKQDVLFNGDGSPVDNGKRTDDHLQWFDYNATREVSPAFAAEVLDDFYARAQNGFIYQPWVQFSEPPFAGKHLSVDIDETGIPFRRTLNPPLDKSKPIVNIFVLGGSTTFGYNVADEHTWPSYLSSILNDEAKAKGLGFQVNVVNYGRGLYETSQEMTLIIDLLKIGHRPRLVLFMDGVNWGIEEDVPFFTRKVEHAVADVQHGNRRVVAEGVWERARKWIPLARLVDSIRLHWQKPSAAGDRPADSERKSVNKEFVTHELERFKQNRRIIKQVCQQYGAEPVFFIQPDAIYNYPANLYRPALPPYFLISREERKLFHEQIRQSGETIYLGQLFDDYGVRQDRKVIIDDCHYSPNFNRFLAERVASYIDLSRIATNSTAYPSVSTGAKRRLFPSE